MLVFLNGRKLWYVVNTYSGHENRVKENLNVVGTMGIQDSCLELLWQKKVIEYKRLTQR